ncbi:LacI family DNA-binding transcriptional regulator [Pseudokordiimonas caeni]|uniref:LacI family DNA-binding transcriptional regulator n=1 Tax=Pseudokordiimonas caeni TaxID=2997908 RepID=UPI002811041C|nr:LacI family DNA-binding transcriptional regulator [Pseudokordiimonas caeni]
MTTIRDISRLAGVSVATVSRTMSNPDKVSPATREKVEAAIRETGYMPDMSARNFSTRKSKTIVVLVPDISNPFFSRVIRGIEHTAQRAGYSVLLGDTRGESEIEDAYASMVRARLADGVIQLNGRLPMENGAVADIPLVNACDCVEDAHIPKIQLDNAGAARAMTEYLISLGHKRIGVAKGPSESRLTQERLRGYREALEAAGLPFDESLVARGDFSASSGRHAATQLMALGKPPTALFCLSDEMAIGAMHSVWEMGLKVPNDISIVGFDDILFAEYCKPPLTTIRQPAEEFGSKAMGMLLSLLQGAHLAETNQHLPYEMVIRQSAGRPKA